MRAYLNAEAVESHPKLPQGIMEGEDKRRHWYLEGLHISWIPDEERWFCELGDDINAIPFAIQDMTQEFSIKITLPAVPHRETGIYGLADDATAEVVSHGTGDEVHLEVHVKGNTMEGAQKLLHQIRTGNIEPHESFEHPQGDRPTYQELREENQELRKRMANASAAFDRFQIAVDELEAEAKKAVRSGSATEPNTAS